jgi:multiple sugar transport system ATP-binding protein
VLRSGTLQQCSAPRELYDSPANIFVATFIGSPSMNLYRAGLESAGESGTVVLGSQRLTLPAAVMRQNPGLARYQGRAVIAGIRPEHLVDLAILGTAPEPGASLTAMVDLVEVLGSEQLVHFTIDAPGVRGEMEEPDQSLAGTGTGAGAGGGGGTGEGEIVAASVAEGVARIDPRSGIRAGERAVFGVDVRRIHFFDPDSGAAIAPTSPTTSAAR